MVAYAWFPVSEETVFFGDAGRSDESVLNLQLPQVNNDTPVEFVVQAQLSNGTVLEDQVQITIQNTFDNALPVVNTTVVPIQTDNRLMASACDSTDSDGTIQTYQWRNETLNIQYEETSCNLSAQLPGSPESQTYTLRAIAIDNEAGLGFKLFNVTTPNRPANTAPVIQSASALPEPVRPGEMIDDFAPNLSFFFSNGMDPEYTVLGRVARRIWAIAMRDKYGASDRSQKLKYHIQTSGRSLHAQEIAFNDIRTTLQALIAVYDHCNSLHTNAYGSSQACCF